MYFDVISSGSLLGIQYKRIESISVGFQETETMRSLDFEVKAENARAKSLSTLISSANYKDVRWGIKLVNGNVGYESKVLTIPQWCAFWVPRLVKEFCLWDV